MDKCLSGFFKQHPRVAVAFSGGVDSTYLLYAGKRAGAEVRAYMVQSCFQPAFELSDAQRAADEMGVPLSVLPVDILGSENVAQNGTDRCYHCKKAVMAEIIASAKKDGFDAVIDGTNASDGAADRPGIWALFELGIYSPLRECGITKANIRAASKEAGLFTHDKPSYACLATRIPAGTRIGLGDLHRIEAAESEMAALGFRGFRVRLLPPDTAKIESTAHQFEMMTKNRLILREKLAPYFNKILLDLDERKE